MAEGPLTEEMKAMVAELRLCYVATVSADDRPNLSPKGSLKVCGDDQLVFADIASPNTAENLRHNPNIEINIVDPFRRRGYRFKGTAELRDDPELIELASAGLGADYPVRQAILVQIEEARPVRSPVYFHTELSEDEVREGWYGKYGLYPRDAASR